MNVPTSLIEQSRFNMVEQQIRPANVIDSAVLDAMLSLPRENFVPQRYKNLAFSDIEIPLEINGIDTHETMLAPKIEARLAQNLQLKPSDATLEIGTGSGFQAALLSRLCNQVLSIEIDTHIAAFAKDNLQREKISNVSVEIGDGRTGWGSAEFNAILVTGSLPNIPDSLKYQLAIGGRLVAIVGQAPVMTAVQITRTTAASFETKSLFETCIKPLSGTTVSHFKF